MGTNRHLSLVDDLLRGEFRKRPEPPRERDVFLAALHAADKREVAEVLDAMCAGDAGLRGRVETMLSAVASVEGKLDDDSPSPSVLSRALDHPIVSGAPSRPGVVVAGRYKLQQLLGEGGMGEVWVADQSEPVRRRVAVKLIKRGMDSPAVVARFEAERQALALMDHPNIARVFDGGLQEHGQPYFAMELVNGLPIGKFCDQAGLGVRERLELFIAVCQAVQHAHQKGIIHRDLKPSNVLVTVIDGKPTPKVIDFGVAKALGGRLTDLSECTKFGAVVGTLEYMAPEQAAYSGTDVDTRADIYALGVLLYELLTGLQPFDSQRMRTAALDEVVRIIREEEPSKPSTRLSTSDSLPSAAAARQADPKRLLGSLRGDLDWITLKCLEKDRNRRYETASALAADVLRHLNDEPVLATPPSASYRLKKFVRKHRPGVAALALVLAAFAAGIAGIAWEYFEADAQRRFAESGWKSADEQRQAAEAQSRLAEKRLAQIGKGVDLFAGILKDINPWEAEKAGPSVYQLLLARARQAADQLGADSVGDPLSAARLQVQLAKTLVGLGDDEKAVELLEQARDVYVAEFGIDHAETQGVINTLATAWRHAGMATDAAKLFQWVREFREAKLGLTHRDTLDTMNGQAMAFSDAGRNDDAVRIYEQMRAPMIQSLGADDPLTIAALSNLASGYHRDGRQEDALKLFREVQQAATAKWGADDLRTLNITARMTGAEMSADDLDAAIRHCEAATASMSSRLPDHPATLVAQTSLANAYQLAGRYDKSLPIYEDLVRRWERRHGRKHPATLEAVMSLGMSLVEAGRPAEATASLEEVLTNSQDRQGMRWVAGAALLRVYATIGKQSDASALATILVAEIRQIGHPNPWTRSEQLLTLGRSLMAIEKYEQAANLINQAYTIRQEQNPGSLEEFEAAAALGAALVGDKKYAEAEPLLNRGITVLVMRQAALSPARKKELAGSMERLADLYTATKRLELAAKWRKDATALRAAAKPVVK